MELQEYLRKLREIKDWSFKDIQKNRDYLSEAHGKWILYDNYGVHLNCELERLVFLLFESDGWELSHFGDKYTKWTPAHPDRNKRIYELGLSKEQRREIIKETFQNRNNDTKIIRQGELHCKLYDSQVIEKDIPARDLCESSWWFHYCSTSKPADVSINNMLHSKNNREKWPGYNLLADFHSSLNYQERSYRGLDLEHGEQLRCEQDMVVIANTLVNVGEMIIREKIPAVFITGYRTETESREVYFNPDKKNDK